MFLYGNISVWDISAKDFLRDLRALQSESDEITMRINCYGGSVFEGVPIFNAIRESEVPIKAQIDGVAASMGAVIFMSAQKRVMAKNANIMFHAAMAGVIGNAGKLREVADQVETLTVQLMEMVAEQAGRPADEIKDWFAEGKDTWFTAKKAFEENLLTEDPVEAVVKNFHVPVLNSQNLEKYVTEFTNLFEEASNSSTNEDLNESNMFGTKNKFPKVNALAEASKEGKEVTADELEAANEELKAAGVGLVMITTGDYDEAEAAIARVKSLETEAASNKKAADEAKATADDLQVKLTAAVQERDDWMAKAKKFGGERAEDSTNSKKEKDQIEEEVTHVDPTAEHNAEAMAKYGIKKLT